jgi:alcohol dehydrogenase class IV
MAPWTFHSAGSLLFGRGAAARTGEVVRRLTAGRVFVVTDGTLAGNGVLDAVRGPLLAAGLAVDVFDGCVPEPPSDVVYAATEVARTAGAGAVVGLGGGSNMDTAKLVALLLAHGGTLDDYVGDCRVPGPVGPLVCLPTTGGTGSEVSPAAVYTDTAKRMKVSCLSNFLRPAVAIVDPLLTVKCPPKVTADSGIDALTHAVDALTAVEHDEFVERLGGETVYQGKNFLADEMARQCIRLVGGYLRRAVANGGDLEARDQMALAGTLGGLAFSNAGVALTHAMEYPVGAAVHVSHGAGNGLLLPHVMRFNEPVRRSELSLVAVLLTPQGGPGIDGAGKVAELCREVGIPTRLRDIGVTEDMLPGFAEKAFAVKRLMRVNPRLPRSADELLQVYRAAY